MNEQAARDILSGKAGGIGPALLRGGLWLVSIPFGCLMRLRRWTYRCGLCKGKFAAVPVVCVGNITTGGTGKTPMVALVVGKLRQQGRKPAILIRGYKAFEGKSDEAMLLEALTGAPVVVNADRAAGAQQAVAGGADVLVMDDGFQHLQLRRDLDIVLLDATNPFGYGHCLPRGLLREPPSALRDAGMIVITRSDAVERSRLDDMTAGVSRIAPGAKILLAAHEPVHVIDEMGRPQALSVLTGKKVLAFCGLGNPDHFFDTLERLGARLVGREALDDHAAYTPQLLAQLGEKGKAMDASCLVTTQKDHVKLQGLAAGLPGWQLAVEMRIVEGQEQLDRCIVQCVSRAKQQA